MRHFKEAESVELGNNWPWKQSEWEIWEIRDDPEVTRGFLTQALGWLVVPFCKTGNPEGAVLAGEGGGDEFNFGKFVELEVPITQLGIQDWGSGQRGGLGRRCRFGARWLLDLSCPIWWLLATWDYLNLN